MARRAIPPETKSRVIAEAAKGEKKLAIIAAENDISLSTAKKWVDEATGVKPTEPVPKAPKTSKPEAASPAPVQEGPGVPLASLAAEKPGVASPGLFDALGSPASSAQPVAPATPAPPPPPMDGKALLAVVTVAKSVIVTNTAMVWGVDLSAEDTARLVEFTKPEREALETLAPYASEYTPAISQYAKPVMALLFGAVMAMSTARSLKEIKARRVPKARDVIAEEAASKPKRSRR